MEMYIDGTNELFSIGTDGDFRVNDPGSYSFSIASKDANKNIFYADVTNEKIYIKDVDFDTVLERLEKLENRGLWNKVKNLFKRVGR
jgi:hypothetical protein